MNCDNTARIHNQVQSDIYTVVVDDDDAGNNECDPDFSIQGIKVKQLVSEHGILILPNPKKKEIETLVKTFYERDDISRMMPRMKDFVSVKNDDGTRSHVQKRLLIYNINELYAQFTEEHEGLKIGISIFTKLRPRHCVLAESNGNQNVCVCMQHEKNIKLMLNEINIQHLTEDTDMSLNNYHNCLDSIVCSESSSCCYLGECEMCPGTAKLKESLRNASDEHGIDEVRFEIWLQTDRCTLQTLVLDTDKFLNDFCERLLKLKTHHFVSKMH